MPVSDVVWIDSSQCELYEPPVGHEELGGGHRKLDKWGPRGTTGGHTHKKKNMVRLVYFL